MQPIDFQSSSSDQMIGYIFGSTTRNNERGIKVYTTQAAASTALALGITVGGQEYFVDRQSVKNFFGGALPTVDAISVQNAIQAFMGSRATSTTRKEKGVEKRREGIQATSTTTASTQTVQPPRGTEPPFTVATAMDIKQSPAAERGSRPVSTQATPQVAQEPPLPDLPPEIRNLLATLPPEKRDNLRSALSLPLVTRELKEGPLLSDLHQTVLDYIINVDMDLGLTSSQEQQLVQWLARASSPDEQEQRTYIETFATRTSFLTQTFNQELRAALRKENGRQTIDTIWIDRFNKGFGTHCHTLNLSSLDLSSPGITVDALKILLQALPNITTLNLSNSPWITDAHLQVIADHAKKLQHLNLSGGRQITDAGCQHLTNMALEELNLDDTPITGARFAALPRTIKKLWLSECHQLTDANLAHLVGMALEELNLSNTLITGAQFAALPRTIKKLDLTVCDHLIEANLAHLAGMALEELNLGYGHTPITGAQLAAQLAALPRTIKTRL